MLRWISLVLMGALVVTACGGPQQSGAGAGTTTSTGASAATAAAGTATTGSATAAPATATAAATGAAQPTAEGPQQLTPITVAMPYIPNVQFAHLYTADKKGYYATEGLQIRFDYNYETDVVQRIANGSGQFGLASGDSVLLARAQGLPVVTIATNSQKFPVVLFSKAAENIKVPADLKDKSVGLPGRFGASYIGLLALLYANNMKERDLNIQEIGFTQAAAVSEGKVQVGVGYGNNEPILLKQQGIDVNVIRVSDYFPLASDGIIASESLIAGQPDVVQGFVRATLRGMQDVIDNPDQGFEISLDYVEELRKADTATRDLQRKVLQETIGYWQSDATAGEGLGYTDKASWEATATFLRDSGLLKSDVDLSKAFTNRFIKG